MTTPAWLQQRIREYFDATMATSYAPNWMTDELSFHTGLADETTPSLAVAHRNTNDKVAELAGITAGARALDAGCGYGGTALHLARTRGARVTGITLHSGQVDVARRAAAEQGVADLVDFVCGDFAATGFADASFDVVYNVESLCHAHDPVAYARHVLGLLRPGGVFVCIDMFRGTSGDPEHARRLCDGWVLPALGTRERLARALADLGFVDVSQEDLTHAALRTASAIRAGAERTALRWRIERAFDAAPAPHPMHEGHVRAGIAYCDGFESGALTYGAVTARAARK